MKHPFAPITKALAVILAGLATAHSLVAQEAIPLDEAQKIAEKLISAARGASDQPFIADVDASKPAGLKGGEAGLIILPDNRLNADVLAKADKTLTPVGQLWMYKVTLVGDGKSMDNGKVRMITVSDGDKSRDVQLFLLGLSKNDQGVLELVIFGKGSEPVLRVPVTKGGPDHDFPIEVSGQGTGDSSALLTVKLPGQYTADLAVVKAGD